ncbi:MAG: TetR/AcrR family transcriptional regulator [Solirubrobacteraceae bacterium]
MAQRGRPRGFDRDQALQRAMDVFWERGYEGTSISELTAAMGIGAPSLYAAFGSKEQLFRETVELYDSLEGAERALHDGPTAREGIEAMLREHAANYTDPETPAGCLIVLGATAHAPENRKIAEYLAGWRRETTEMLRARLARGVEEGDVPGSVDVDALAAYFNTLLEGLSIEARDGASREQLDRTIDCAMAAWEPLTAARAAG